MVRPEILMCVKDKVNNLLEIGKAAFPLVVMLGSGAWGMWVVNYTNSRDAGLEALADNITEEIASKFVSKDSLTVHLLRMELELSKKVSADPNSIFKTRTNTDIALLKSDTTTKRLVIETNMARNEGDIADNTAEIKGLASLVTETMQAVIRLEAMFSKGSVFNEDKKSVR